MSALKSGFVGDNSVMEADCLGNRDRRHLRKALRALTAMCLLGLATQAQSTCSRPYTAVVSQLGYTAFQDDNGQLRGIVVDVFHELAQRSGCQITIEDMPAPRVSAMMGANQIAMLGLAAPLRNPSPNDIYIPLRAATIDLIIRSEYGAKTPNAAFTNPRVIFGTLRGASYGGWADNYLRSLPEKRREPTDSIRSIYRKLAIGRVGATFGFAEVYRLHVDEMRLGNQLRIIPIPEAPRAIGGILINSGIVDMADAKLLQRTLEMIRDDGSLRRITAQYLGDAKARDELWRKDRDGSNNQ